MRFRIHDIILLDFLPENIGFHSRHIHWQKSKFDTGDYLSYHKKIHSFILYHVHRCIYIRSFIPQNPPINLRNFFFFFFSGTPFSTLSSPLPPPAAPEGLF
mmetsp:Transcript_15682/g.22835  ORF Transcript_15682/g.22835 Transcript_15682/m.22835 type:complete len:101 (+) Transcript_15682:39-341(+)